MNNLQCKTCGAALASENINRRLGIIDCNHCNSIYDLTRTRQNKDIEAKVREPVPLPENFKLVNDQDKLTIYRKWNNSSLIALCASFLFLGLGLFQLLSMSNLSLEALISKGISISDIKIADSRMGGFLIIFYTFFIGVSLANIYKEIARAFNTTKIIICKKYFKVNHYPLPWFPKPSLLANDIEQIYIKEHRKEVRRKKSETTDIYYSYSVNAINRQGTTKVIVREISDVTQALYLEQEIENHLNIRDRNIAGEYMPDTIRN